MLDNIKYNLIKIKRGLEKWIDRREIRIHNLFSMNPFRILRLSSDAGSGEIDRSYKYWNNIFALGINTKE